MGDFNTIDSHLSKTESERYFRVLDSLVKFSELFDYSEKSDRAIAIIGPAFLDFLLGGILTEFLVDDEKEVKYDVLASGWDAHFGTAVYGTAFRQVAGVFQE